MARLTLKKVEGGEASCIRAARATGRLCARVFISFVQPVTGSKILGRSLPVCRQDPQAQRSVNYPDLRPERRQRRGG